MNSYLNFTCGNYELLLSASYILEVGNISSSNNNKSSKAPEKNKKTYELHRIWRDRNLPVINLGGYLQLSSPDSNYQLVTFNTLIEDESDSDSELELTILDVEEITGLLEINDDDFVDIATPSQSLEQFIDKSYIHPVSKKCLLRMTYPFSWMSSS